MSGADHEVFESLLMKATDGVITPDESRVLDEHAAGCESCRDELRDFLQLKEITDTMRDRILADARIEPFRPGKPTRAFLNLSFMLLAVGLLLLLGFAAVVFFADETVSPVVKIGAGVAGLGALGLFVYAIVVRLRSASRDPYEEIDR
jgi:anti-sigma factor RsiW